MNSLQQIIAVGLTVSSLASGANPLLHPQGLPGFIVLAEQRYDPAVQRFMAEQSLRALPLRNGQLFYVYPTNTSNAYIEQMQIRYLEVMLEKKAAEIEPENE